LAVKVSFGVEGLAEFQNAMQKLDVSFQNQVFNYLVSWAADVKAEAEKAVPVRTGYLRSTIFAQVKGWIVEVGADAAYAAAIEFGTRYMQAQPYLWPTIQQALPTLEEILKEAFEAARQEAGL
jgi:HK97 gp10 family phage protein